MKRRYEDKVVIESLAGKNEICLMKQDNGRGIVIVNRSRYTEKCENMLDSDKSLMLENDPTSKLEGQVQRALRKIKGSLSESDYIKSNQIKSKKHIFGRFAK